MQKLIQWVGRAASSGGDGPELTETDKLRRLRYVKAARTTVASGVNTVLNAAIGFVAVALTVRYLGAERYGIWLTISTLLSWLTLTDFGISNALTNRLAAAQGRIDSVSIKNDVATAFWLMAVIGAVIAIVGAALGWTLPWGQMLNISSASITREVAIAIALAFVIYGFGFPLGITASVYNGHQEGYYTNLWSIAASLVSLLGLIVATRGSGGLPALVLATFGLKQLVALASFLFLFGRHRLDIAPSLRSAKTRSAGPLLQLGFMFISLQLAGLLITQSDNLVIIRVLGPNDVAVYGTLWRLFSYVAVAQMWILTPLWPAYGEAYARGDAHWLKRTLKLSLAGCAVLTAVLSSFLVLAAREIVRVWAGAELVPSMSLLILMALLQLMWAWTQPLVYFLNGISRLRGQMVYGVATAVLCVILKIWLVPRVGSPGAVVGTLAAYVLLEAWLLPIDVRGAFRALSTRQSSAAGA